MPFAKYFAELLGVAGIVATVLGAGFMVSNLGAEPAVGLTLIAMAVAAVLFIVISIFGPISGAHLNPAVTLVMLVQKSISLRDAIFYVAFQLLGAVAGAATANLMYEQAAIGVNGTVRGGAGQLIGEFVATVGLVFIVLSLIKLNQGALIAPAVALWILAGHFFTSSTSFANPAAVFGRMFSDTFSGIAPKSAPLFVLAEIIGGLLGYLGFKALTSKTKSGK